MRLQSIAIDNFRVLKRARLEFPDQVIGIIGPNGAGKSSIVEAVAWAMYGHRVARSGKEEIRSTYASGDDPCAVGLEFEIGREHYRLERRLLGRTERPEVILFRGGQRESAGSSDTEKYVAHLMGLDWRGFLTSFLARQQELNSLANLAPGERRDFLAGMLGIDRLDRALRLVKDDRKGAEQAADFLQQQMADRDRVQAVLAQLREHVSLLESQHVTSTGAREAAAQQLVRTESEYREHEARQAACSQVQSRLDTGAQTLAHLAERRQSLSVQLAKLELLQTELNGLEPRLSGLESLRAELEEMRKRREVATRRDALIEQANTRKSELELVERAESDGARELGELVRKQGEIPSDLVQLIAATSVALEEARKKWADQKAKLAADEKTATLLTEQLESIRQVGPDAVCERCHRPFGDDLPEIQKHLAAELETIEQACKLHRKDLADCQDEGAALKRETERLQLLDQQRREYELRIGGLTRQATEVNDRKQKILAQLKQLGDQIAACGKTRWDPDRFAALSEKLVDLETVRARALELRGELKTLPDTRESLAAIGEQAAQAESAQHELEKEIQKIGFDRTAFETLASRLTGDREKLDEAKRVCLEQAKELELARRDIQHREEDLARLAEIGRKLEETRTNQYYAEKLVSLFGDFRKYTISRIRPRLAELSSQLMAEMSAGRYSLVELDEDYNLQVMDNGEYFGIDRFSGGEKDLASLCLRLSISLALTESAGLDRSFIILDEVFGSQDSNRRELIFESLANLKARFPQMLLITHLDELRHKVETLVELAPQPGGWSEVRVNGRIV